MKRVVLSALLVLGSAAPFQAQTPQALTDGFPVAGAPAIVKLISAGAEPRTALRYVIPKDYKDHMDVSMTMSMSMDMGGLGAQQMDMPTMDMGMDLAASDVSPEGDVTYSVTFTGIKYEPGPNTDPTLLSALQGSTTNLDKMRSTVTVSNRGLTKHVAPDVSALDNQQAAQLVDQMSSSVQSLSAPFPEEPVGVGARWEVRQVMPANGVQMFNKMTVEVVSIDGPNVALKMTIDMSAPSQAISNPMMPPGASVQLDSFTGSGSGTIAFNLARLVPTGEMNQQMAMGMSVSMNGNNMSMQTSNSTKIKVAPGPAGK